MLHSALVLLALVVLVFGLVLAFLSPLALRVANAQLPGLLGTPAAVQNVHVSLARGTISISGLAIDQPDGFEPGRLARLGTFSVRIDLASLRSDVVTIQSLSLDGLALNVIKDAHGVMNVQRLGPPASDKPEPAETVGAKSASRVPGILVRTVDVRNVSITYQDLTQAGRPLTITLDPVSLALTNLVIAPAGVSTGLPGEAWAVIEGRIAQSPYSNACLLAAARLGPVTTGIPDVNAVLRLVGFELSTAGPLVPPGAAGTIGGDAMDVSASLALCTNLLDCQIVLRTIAGHVLSLPIGGTPDQPEIDKTAVLFSAFGRLGGGVGNLVGGVGGAGLSVLTGAGQAVGSVAAGAGGAVMSVGKGLFQTARGAASGDLSHMAGGLKQTTLGTVGEAAGGVTGAGSNIVSGARDAGSSAVGGPVAARWRATVPDRWTAERTSALALLGRMRFPPVRLKEGPAWDAEAAEHTTLEEDPDAPVPMWKPEEAAPE